MGAAEEGALITVVTPVRNGERFLKDAIESVRRQTLQRWEYFIVDGASTDRTLELATEAAAIDSRIRVISEPDKGMYDALFKGLGLGKGSICCWLNSDDMYLPWAFELVLEYMLGTGAEWVTGIPAFWDSRGRMVRVGSLPWYPRGLIARGWFHGRGLGWIQQESTFFARRLLEKLSPGAVERIRGAKLAGDFLLWVELSKYASLHVIPTVLGGFRVHGENMSSRNLQLYFQEIETAGFWLPPPAIRTLLQLGFRPLKVVMGWVGHRYWLGRS